MIFDYFGEAVQRLEQSVWFVKYISKFPAPFNYAPFDIVLVLVLCGFVIIRIISWLRTRHYYHRVKLARKRNDIAAKDLKEKQRRKEIEQFMAELDKEDKVEG